MASDRQAAEQVRRCFLLRSPISGQVYGAANDREQLRASSAYELVEMVDVSDLQRVLADLRAEGAWKRGHRGCTRTVGWEAALDAVATDLGLDGGGD